MDECVFDDSTGDATEGLVVDSDDDLAELCARMRNSEHKNCEILFADETDEPDGQSKPDTSLVN